MAMLKCVQPDICRGISCVEWPWACRMGPTMPAWVSGLTAHALQGLADYALAAAGGKVEGHSRLAYVHPEAMGLWRRTSAALLPGAGGVVHPEADKASLRPSWIPYIPIVSTDVQHAPASMARRPSE